MQLRTAAALCTLILSGAAAVKPAVKEAGGPAAQAAATPAAAASKPKISKEKAAQDALPQLQSIMAKAQSSLARAERHHEKAVKKARSKAESLFQQQAKLMGAAVASYKRQLAQAADGLSLAINASKAELAAEEAAEAKKDDGISWGGAAMEERARAGARADAALRELRHIARKTDRDVEEAARHAGAPIEDAAQRLGRRVGDLSQLADQARSTLEALAREGGAGQAALLQKPSVASDPKGVERAIEAARNQTATKLAAADKELAVAIANATNATNGGVQLIEKDLLSAEQLEIKRVRR